MTFHLWVWQTQRCIDRQNLLLSRTKPWAVAATCLVQSDVLWYIYVHPSTSNSSFQNNHDPFVSQIKQWNCLTIQNDSLGLDSNTKNFWNSFWITDSFFMTCLPQNEFLQHYPSLSKPVKWPLSSYLQSVSLTGLRVEYIWHIVTLGIASSCIIVRIPNLSSNRVTSINLRFSVSASAFSNFGSTPALSMLFSQCTCEAIHTPPASFCTSENTPSSET